MRIARSSFFCVFFALFTLSLLAACTPLRRGFDGALLVSPAQPSLSVTVPGLPLLAAGQSSPFVYSQYGFVTPETFVAAYGTAPNAPFAAVVLTFVPNESWQWDPLSFSRPDSPVTSHISLGNQAFDGSLHIIGGQGDPFTPLFPGMDTEKAAELRWLTQRYACLLFFQRAKVILEYREPVPASLAKLAPGDEVPVWNADVQAFQERAASAFAYTAPYAGQGVQNADYIKTLDGKGLGPYLGSLSRNELFVSPDD